MTAQVNNQYRKQIRVETEQTSVHLSIFSTCVYCQVAGASLQLLLNSWGYTVDRLQQVLPNKTINMLNKNFPVMMIVSK